MGTFLTTAKMSRELAARVEASVRGQRAARPLRRRSRSVAALRLAALVAIVALVAGIATVQRRARERLENDRAALLSRIRQASASLGPREKSAPARVQAWLQRCSGQYPGDRITDELRAPGALEATLRRSIVYMRAPLASFERPSGIVAAAALSFKDAFALCFVDPPAARTERSLLASSRGAYARVASDDRPGAFGARAPQVERFYYALYGIPFLLPDWERRVIGATTELDLNAFARAFHGAPLERARRAARSELLLFAMDEPSVGAGPAELDGERARDVRVGLVDLVSEKVLFRLRRRVDPSWLSPAARAEYASAIDSCALAYDVRREVFGHKDRSGG